MSHPSGLVPVSLAIAGNTIITIIKIVGFFLTNSSALFSESIHSVADTMNQSLLLFGIQRSRRAADDTHAYGYGGERFLWALISACGIFFLGAGVTIAHGVGTFLHPETTHITIVAFVILLVSFLVEGATLWKAASDLRRAFPEDSFVEALREGDPATIAVVYEDGVALFGVVVAFLSMMGTYLTGDGRWDAAGSIVIGFCLAAIAIILIEKNRSFLLRRTIPEDVREEIIDALVAEPAIKSVVDFKSTVLDIDRFHVKCEVEWNGAALADEVIEDDLEDDFDEIGGDYTEFKRYLAYTVNRVPRLIGREIDAIEKRITAKFPEVVHLDIEIN